MKIRHWFGMGFLAGALAAAVWNASWWSVFVTGLLTALVFGLYGIVREGRREWKQPIVQNERSKITDTQRGWKS